MSLILDSPPDATGPATDRDEAELRARLAQVQRVESRRRWATRLGMLLLMVAALVIALAAWDFAWPLATLWRGLGMLGVLAAGALMFLAIRRHCRYASADAAADVEARFPRYGQRLRTTLDYAERPGASAPAAPQLLRALHSETHQLAASDDFTAASSPRSVYLVLAACLVLLVGCGITLLMAPELWTTAGRLLLLPLHYTQVTVDPIKQPIRQGEDALVQIHVDGRPVGEAEALYRSADTRQPWQRISLLPEGAIADDDPSLVLTGSLSGTIQDCQNDLEVLVVTGPESHAIQRVKVLLPLELQGFSAQVQPPEYTRREPEMFESESFVVWEGSNVDLHFEMNRPPARAMLKPQQLAESPDESDDGQLAPIELSIVENRVSGHLPDIRKSLRFVLDAETADGIALDSPRYHIRVRMDKKPEIRFTSPEEQLEVIPTTEVPLAIEASDDLGVMKAGVVYKIGDTPPVTLWEQQFDPSEVSLHAENMLPLEDQRLTYHDAVTYYAFAEDNYFGQPRRVTTELRFIDIRPFKREYQILQAQGGT